MEPTVCTYQHHIVYTQSLKDSSRNYCNTIFFMQFSNKTVSNYFEISTMNAFFWNSILDLPTRAMIVIQRIINAATRSLKLSN